MKGGYHSPPAKSKMSTRGLENSDLIFFFKKHPNVFCL